MRLDKFLAAQGLADSRTRAERLILSGGVKLDGKLVTKPSLDVDESCEHAVEIQMSEKYVSRGGLKLEGALDAFGLDVSGLSIIDVGASTGGFTHCLLERGARDVTALDSGHGQLHTKIRNDARVRVIEGYNARNLSAADVGTFDGAVMDVSFISQTLIIPALVGVIRDGGFFVGLIKPQFESGRAALSKGGIVKNALDREAAVIKVVECAKACNLRLCGLVRSSIEGGDGNIEYLGLFRKVEDTSLDITDRQKIKQICK